MSNTHELVFIPTPGMGHILSTVQLAKLILQRTENISIFIHIINIPMHSAKVNEFIEAQSRDNPYPTRLIFVTFPTISNLSNSSSPFTSATTIELHKPLVKQAVEERVRAGFPKPVGFVLDLFCTGMIDVANELHVPSYIFFTSGVGILNLTLYAQSQVDYHGIDVVTEFSKPGFVAVVPGFKNSVTTNAIPRGLQDKALCDMFLNFMRKFRTTKGILVNTYEELEPFGIQALRDGDGHNIPRVYPVGPILDLDDESRGGSDSESVMQWLDSQPSSSVVFLCFGSMGFFEQEQVKEIANGLDRTGHRFLWALRKPPPEGKSGTPSDNEPFLEALPEGFVDRTADRGKIIGWAPQIKVLSHPAIGGFVSHCGWNSTLESLWFGVPMATWPMYAEQQLNAFELVKELKLAVDIKMEYKRDLKSTKGSFLVTAEEVEKGINNLMKTDKELKENVEKMSAYGIKALEKEGSSYMWLGRFIQDVLNNAL